MTGERDDKSDFDVVTTTIDTGDSIPGEVITGAAIASAKRGELDEVLGELEALLKNGDVMSSLAESGINTSLALVAASALRSYLDGKKIEAAEDFATVAEEILARLAAGRAAIGHGGS